MMKILFGLNSMKKIAFWFELDVEDSFWLKIGIANSSEVQLHVDRSIGLENSHKYIS